MSSYTVPSLKYRIGPANPQKTVAYSGGAEGLGKVEVMACSGNDNILPKKSWTGQQ